MPRPRSKPRKQPIPQAKRPAVAKPAVVSARPATSLPPAAEGEKRVLHLGWHSALPNRLPKDFQGEGWSEIRYDMSPAVKPTIVGRPEKLEAIPDASVEAVYAPQLLQRFPSHHIPMILGEIKRVIKQGGMLALTVPNVQIAASYVATEQAAVALYSTPVGPITPIDLIYGLRVGQAKGQEQDYHRFGFTPQSIGLILRDFGYSNIFVATRGHEIVSTARVFAFDHPERVEKITVSRNDQAAASADVAPPPVPAGAEAAVSQPRRAPGGKGLADELDLPPLFWKPLGLKK